MHVDRLADARAALGTRMDAPQARRCWLSACSALLTYSRPALEP